MPPSACQAFLDGVVGCIVVLFGGTRWTSLFDGAEMRVTPSLGIVRWTKTVDVSNTTIPFQGYRELAEYLKGDETVKVLRLRDVSMWYPSMQVLAIGLAANQTLEELWVSDNYHGWSEARLLAKALTDHPRMRTLSLINNLIDEDETVAMTAMVDRSWSIQNVFLIGSPSSVVSRVLYARDRCRARQNLLPMMFYAGVETKRNNPLRRFLEGDGDHAVSSRVLEFLVCSPCLCGARCKAETIEEVE